MARLLKTVLRSFKAAPDVFISYRRRDAVAEAELIHDRLIRAIGISHVFFDQSIIQSGEDFVKKIAKGLNASQIVLAVIGPQWLTITQSEGGERRLDDPDDFVRREIEAALARKDDVRLIPVLVHGAQMPQKGQLPASLAGLTDRSAHEIRETHFDEDLGILVEDILGIRQLVPYILKRGRFRRLAISAALFITGVMFFAAWVELGGWLAIDARVENHIMALGDMIETVPPSDRVATVAINEASEKFFAKKFDVKEYKFGKMWRQHHARLIEKLSDSGAAVIAFDIYMDEPSEFDEELIAAIKAAQRKGTMVILGAENGLPASSAFRDVLAGGGLLCIGGPRELSYATLAPLAVERGEHYLTAITASSVALGGKVEDIDFTNLLIRARDPAGRLRRIGFSRSEELKSNTECKALSKGDRVAQLIVHISPLDALRDPARRYQYEAFFDESAAAPPGNFNGKIVLIGSEDKRDERRIRYRFHQEDRFGYEVHADVLKTLDRGIAIRPLDDLNQFLITLAMAMLGQICLLMKPFRLASVRRLYGVAIVAAYLALGVAIYVEARILLNALYHISAFLLTYWASIRIARRLQLWEMRTR